MYKFILIDWLLKMGKGNKARFDKKKAVRFTLIPGPIKDGKPSVLFKPVETQKTRLSKK